MIDPLKFPPTREEEKYFSQYARTFTRADYPLSWEAVFKHYQASVRVLCEQLGLQRWHIGFAIHEDAEASADVAYRMDGFAAVFGFSTKLPCYLKPDYDTELLGVDELAAHEVLHLLFAEYERHLVEDDISKQAREDLADSLQHGLINVLAPIILEHCLPRTVVPVLTDEKSSENS